MIQKRANCDFLCVLSNNLKRSVMNDIWIHLCEKRNIP